MIPGLWGKFKTSKRILENLGNLREKIDQFEHLEQFELPPDMLATLHRQKTLTKLFCLYSTLPREVSVRSYPTYTSVQSTEHSGFSSESYTQQLIRSYSPKWVVQLNVSCYITIKKTELFKNFPEFLRVFGEFQTFLKRILELLGGGNFGKNFRRFSGIMQLSPTLIITFPFLGSLFHHLRMTSERGAGNAISYLESSGSLVSGWSPTRL